MAKPGPKPRADRAERPIAYRPHVKVESALKARAEAAGMSWAEYTEYIVAQALGLPDFAPQPTTDSNHGQEALLPDPLSP